MSNPFSRGVMMSPKIGNNLGSFGLIFIVQPLFKSVIFYSLCIIFSMFVSLVRIREVTFPRWLIRVYLRFFDIYWSKVKAIMSYKAAKPEVRT